MRTVFIFKGCEQYLYLMDGNGTKPSLNLEIICNYIFKLLIGKIESHVYTRVKIKLSNLKLW